MTALHQHLGWYVQLGESSDGCVYYDIYDADDDVVDGAMDLKDAIAACNAGAAQAYKDHLIETIQMADLDGRSLKVLESIVDLLQS
jgi:hypothetical protein